MLLLHTVLGCYLHGLVANVRDDEHFSSIYLDGEVAVEVGDCSVLSISIEIKKGSSFCDDPELKVR